MNELLAPVAEIVELLSLRKAWADTYWRVFRFFCM